MGARTVTVIPATFNPLTRMPNAAVIKRRTAGYARVSTDKDEQYTSYEAQVDYYTNYIRQHTDWEFVKVYTDEGISGLNTKNRDGFNDMITDALAGRIDLIITKSVSRFARNTVDSLTTIRKLKEKGVEVYFEKENIWTFDGKGELLLTIMSSLAQEESRSISENVTWGQRKRFSDGKVSLPYKHFLGYDRGENKDDPPVVNPEQAVLVRRIYSLFMQGKTPGNIARILTEEGIPTPSGKEKWPTTTIDNILKNEKYRGSARLQKKFTVDFLTKKQKVNEGEIPQYYIEESHEAIINPVEWDAVQDEIKRRKAIGRSYNGMSIFSTRLVCGCCGSWYGHKIWHSTDKYRSTVWLCNRKYSKDKPNCDTPALTEEDLKSRFLKTYNRMLDSREEILTACLAARDRLMDTAEIDRQLDALMEEITVVTELTRKCVLENTASVQDQEEYAARYNGYAERYEKAKEQFDDLTAKREALAAKGRAIERFLSGFAAQENPLTEFDDMLWLTSIDRVTVQSDGTLLFRFFSGAEIEG